jgi:hypothetical protein
MEGKGMHTHTYMVLVGKPEGKRPLGASRRRLEDSVKMDFREIVLFGMEWIHLAQNRNQWRSFVNRGIHFWVL